MSPHLKKKQYFLAFFFSFFFIFLKDNFILQCSGNWQGHPNVTRGKRKVVVIFPHSRFELYTRNRGMSLARKRNAFLQFCFMVYNLECEMDLSGIFIITRSFGEILPDRP